MMDTQKGLIVFECDNCAEVLETEETGLRKAVAELRAHRWRFHNNTPDNQFKHYCPACK